MLIFFRKNHDFSPAKRRGGRIIKEVDRRWSIVVSKYKEKRERRNGSSKGSKWQSHKVSMCLCAYGPLCLPNRVRFGIKIKNKANFKLGKIDVSSLLTSEYEDYWAFLCFLGQENKANPAPSLTTPRQVLSRHKFQDYRHKTSDSR